MKFSALAGNGMQRIFSDAAAVLFFLKEEKEKNGGAKRADRVVRPYIQSPRAVQNRRSGPMRASAPTNSISDFRRADRGHRPLQGI